MPAQVTAQEPPAPPAAKAEDVASPDAIIAAVYDVISGPAGQARDWDRFRSLFMPGARLIPTGPRPDGGFGHSMLTAEDYVTRAGPGLERDGFFEREIHRVEERFGPQRAQVGNASGRFRHPAPARPRRHAAGIPGAHRIRGGVRHHVLIHP
jgi:hypothetical protein